MTIPIQFWFGIILGIPIGAIFGIILIFQLSKFYKVKHSKGYKAFIKEKYK